MLCTLGLQIHNKQILSMLADHQAKVDMDNFHVNMTEEIIQKALKTAPPSFKLYDVMGNQTHDFSDYNVHFTPGSSTLSILDGRTPQMRKPLTNDYIGFQVYCTAIIDFPRRKQNTASGLCAEIYCFLNCLGVVGLAITLCAIIKYIECAGFRPGVTRKTDYCRQTYKAKHMLLQTTE